MNQEGFEKAREERWGRFETMLKDLESGTPVGADFPPLYRLLCQDLALARDRGFSALLVDRLNTLALRGHRQLYRARIRSARPLDLLVRRFPRAVRRDASLVALMALLFFGSGLVLFVLDLRYPSLVYNLLSADQVEAFEAMYDPASEFYGAPRNTTGDFGAFAYYVWNNVGIGLRTFAWGVFCGIGSVLIILFNGVYLGLVAAHLTNEGLGAPFYSFAITHGSFELTAIVLAGTVGMKIGWAFVAPGAFTRLVALRKAASESVPTIYGMVVMLLIAAVIEAFWSSSASIPPEGKFAAGAVLWLLVGVWLVLGGRGHEN